MQKILKNKISVEIKQMIYKMYRKNVVSLMATLKSKLEKFGFELNYFEEYFSSYVSSTVSNLTKFWINV